MTDQKNGALLKNDYFLKRISGKFVVASVFSMIFLYAGSLIDTLIVGFFVGEPGLSAMSLVSPVYLVFYTVGATIGIGGSIAASRMLGKNDMKGYLKVFTCTAVMLFLSFIVMTAAGFAFLNPIADALSGTSGKNALVLDYLRFYIPGGGFTLLAYLPLYFLKTEGKPRVSSLLFGASAVINVLLSWLFMSPVCNMGIGGASLATSISMCTTAVAGYAFLFLGNKNLRFTRESLKIGNIRSVVVAGIPNGLSNLLESLRILILNSLLLFIGAASLLPCYTVVRNVNDLLGSVMIGISSALLPLLGVFYGEHDHTNVRSILGFARKIGLLVMAPLIITVCLIPDVLSGLFGVADPALLAANRLALPLSCVGLLAAYINTLNIGYLTATKRERLANILVMLRLFLFVTLFAVFLSFPFGANGIWASLSLTEIATMLSYYVIRLIIRKKRPLYDRILLDTSRESKDDVIFSVKNDVNDIVNSSDKINEFCEEHDIDMKKAMRVSLAIEEVLTVLISQCLDKTKEQYIDIRVCKLENEVMMRFRYMGKVFDPAEYYNSNKNNDEMSDSLLGLKMIVGYASLIDFNRTLGVNNLMIIF